MAKKKILLLLLTLLIASGTGCRAQDNDMHEFTSKNDVSVMKLDMDIFSLLNMLEDNMPLTRQKIIDAGFELTKDGWGGSYTATSIELNDGTILDDIELRDITSPGQEGTLFILNIKNKRITRKELEENLGAFTLYSLPRGHSIKEEIVYRKRVGCSDILAGYGQKERDVLIGISFDSVGRKP